MHHRHTRRPSAACPAVPNTKGHTNVVRSPLAELDRAFLALANAADPLTLPAHFVCEQSVGQQWPVDQFRSRLAHPSTPPSARAVAWSEVVRRARELGAPWDVVACAMALPVLRRMLARPSRPAFLERAEMEQEALAALAGALATVTLDEEALVDRELFAAADRALHRLVYAAQRRARHEAGPRAYLGRLNAPAVQRLAHGAPDEPPVQVDGDEGDEFAVLARAVQARVVDVAEARLIARTRLEGESMQRIADERRVSVRQLYRHRTAAEQHLADYLARQLRQDQ